MRRMMEIQPHAVAEWWNLIFLGLCPLSLFPGLNGSHHKRQIAILKPLSVSNITATNLTHFYTKSSSRCAEVRSRSMSVWTTLSLSLLTYFLCSSMHAHTLTWDSVHCNHSWTTPLFAEGGTRKSLPSLQDLFRANETDLSFPSSAREEKQ